MPTTWKAVRVFISSTFRDMHAERDHLVKVVFPELRERLEAHHIHLIDIDLRWGVTAEQADNDRVLDLCLDQIDRCRPFFVGILGRRYGWVPAELPEMDQVRYGWVQAVTGKSITELEILHGVLRNPQLRGHAVFLFRKGHFLADVPEEIRRQVYEDEHAEKLGALQEEIRAYCREHDAPFHEYDCEWDGSKPNPEDGTRGRVVGLEQFGRWVADDLWAAIATEHPQILKEAAPPAQAGTDDWLAEEQDYHERFIESRTQVYIDRGKIQVLLAHYLESAATQPLVLVGGSGTGKSAILGTLFKHYRKQHGDELVLPHFVGASPSSTDLPLMLRRFCHALRSHFGLAEPIEHGDQGDEAAQGHPAPRTVPEDAERLPGAFGEFLEAVPEDRRAVLIIDAVNELNEAGHAHEMHWLPAELQPNVKIIVSCIDEPNTPEGALDVLRRRGSLELAVDPLSAQERRAIIHDIPSLSAKALDADQVDLLLANPATTNPLYLTVALEELRGFGSFERLNEKIASFPRIEGEEGIDALFAQVIDRLEMELDADIVGNVLALICCSRQGLSEGELEELLGQIGAGPADEEERAGQLQVLLRQLRRHLLRRGQYLDFFHRSLYKAVRVRYLSEEDAENQAHRHLAAYFGLETHPSGRAAWASIGPRGLSEVVYHQTKACLWPEVERALCDLRFVRAKCAAGLTDGLISDYDLLEAGPAQPDPPLQTAWRRRGAYGARCPHCRAWHEIQADVLGRRIACPACGRQFQLNDFWIEGPWQAAEPPPPGAVHPAPAEDVPCRQALSQFARFVYAESRLLADHPDVAVQQAANSPDDTILSRQATALLDRAATPWLRWVNRSPLRQECVMVLRGHRSRVQACGFSPDGARVVSGSADGTVRLWAVRTGACLATQEAGARVQDCAWSWDGRRIAAGSWDGAVRIWDAWGRACLRILRGPGGPVLSCSWSPDDARLVSVGYDGAVCLWETETGRRIGTAPARHATRCRWSPDGRRILVAYRGGHLELLDPSNGRRVGEFAGHHDEVLTCEWSPDGTCFASGSADRTLRTWDADSTDCLRIFRGHRDAVAHCAWSPDGRRLLSGSEDGTLRFWDRATGACINWILAHSDGVCTCAWSPDNRRAVSGSAVTGDIRLWETVSQRDTEPQPVGRKFTGSTCGWAPWGTRIAAGTRDGDIVVQDVASEAHWTLHVCSAGVDSVAWSPAADRLCAMGSDGVPRIVALANGASLDCQRESLVTGSSGPGRFGSCIWSPDGARIACGPWNGTVDVWDTRTGALVHRMTGHSKDGRACSWSPEGGRILCGSDDGVVTMWQADSGDLVASFEGHEKAVAGCTWSPDGSRIASTCLDGTMRVWDVATGTCMACERLGIGGTVAACEWSPEGRWLASARGWNGSVLLWDATTGRIVEESLGQGTPIAGLRWFPDGRRIVAWSLGWARSVSVALLEVDPLRLVAGFATTDSVRQVDVSADGQRVAILDSLHTIYILELKNLRIDPPLVAAVRRYDFSAHGLERRASVSCPSCGFRLNWPARTTAPTRRSGERSFSQGARAGHGACERVPFACPRCDNAMTVITFLVAPSG